MPQCWLMPAVCVSRTDCLREVHCALALLKPLCLVFDPVRGGAPLPDLEAECDVKLQPAIFGPPDNKRDVIPWHRIKDVRLPHPLARPSRSPLPSPPHSLSRPFAAPKIPHHSIRSSNSWRSSSWQSRCCSAAHYKSTVASASSYRASCSARGWCCAGAPSCTPHQTTRVLWRWPRTSRRP